MGSERHMKILKSFSIQRYAIKLKNALVNRDWLKLMTVLLSDKHVADVYNRKLRTILGTDSGK